MWYISTDLPLISQPSIFVYVGSTYPHLIASDLFSNIALIVTVQKRGVLILVPSSILISLSDYELVDGSFMSSQQASTILEAPESSELHRKSWTWIYWRIYFRWKDSIASFWWWCWAGCWERFVDFITSSKYKNIKAWRTRNNQYAFPWWW